MIYIIHQETLEIRQFALLKPHFSQLKAQGKHWRGYTQTPISSADLELLRSQLQMDINLLPEDFDPQSLRLMISDMDSTMIGIECVDEIADFAKVKPQVAEITQAAMRGELDFAASLKKRVALLKDLPLEALEEVYTKRLFLNPGAEALMQGLAQRGIATALVSGGFTFFTQRLQKRLGFNHTLANVLGQVGNRLTGTVTSEIVDGQKKAEFLQQLAQQGGFSPQNAIAVGDGANDLPMMALAGLSVAYHAKPKVRQAAKAQLNVRGLDGILDFLD